MGKYHHGEIRNFAFTSLFSFFPNSGTETQISKGPENYPNRHPSHEGNQVWFALSQLHQHGTLPFPEKLNQNYKSTNILNASIFRSRETPFERRERLNLETAIALSTNSNMTSQIQSGSHQPKDTPHSPHFIPNSQSDDEIIQDFTLGGEQIPKCHYCL